MATEPKQDDKGLAPEEQVAAVKEVDTDPKAVEQAISDGYSADLETHINGGAGAEPLSPMQIEQKRRDASGESAYRPNKSAHTRAEQRAEQSKK